MVRISRRFIKSSIIYTIAGALPMASAIILLPFYLIYLSTDNFGALSIYLAFSVLVQILTTYSFDTGIYVYFHEYKNDQKKLKAFISSAFLFTLIVGCGITVFFVVGGNFLFEYFFAKRGLHFLPFGLMSVVTGVFQSLFKIHSSLLQSSERPVLFFWSNLLSFSLIAGLTVLGLHYYPNTLLGPVGGRMVAAIISGVWALARIFYHNGIRFDYALLKLSFSFNNSSFIYQLQQWSVNYFDRFIMVFFLPLSMIGVYDFAIKCMLAVEFVMSGLYNAFYPKVIGTVMNQTSKQSTVEINRYYHGFTAVIMLLVCFAILFFSLLIDAGFIRSGYQASREYFPLIGMIYLIRITRYYFAFPYGALKYSKPLPLIYLIVSLVKIGLIVSLIDHYGIYSVIGAAVVTTLMEIYLLWYFIKGRFQFRFNYTKLIIAPLTVAFVVGMLQLFNSLNSYLVYAFYLFFCLLVLTWFYRNEIKMIASRNLFQ